MRRYAFVAAVVLLLILAGMVLARDLPAEGWAAYPPADPYPAATATPWPTVTPEPTVAVMTPLPAPKRPTATAMPPPDGLPYFPSG